MATNRAEEFQHAVQVLEDLKGRLLLTDWHIDVRYDPQLKDAYASCAADETSRHGTIKIGPLFFKEPAARRPQILAHELLHCHLFALHDLVSGITERSLGKKACRIADFAINQQVELLTDTLADVVVNLLGFPPAVEIRGPSPATPNSLPRPPRSGQVSDQAGP